MLCSAYGTRVRRGKAVGSAPNAVGNADGDVEVVLFAIKVVREPGHEVIVPEGFEQKPVAFSWPFM